jgi:hypothetical protein
MREFFSASLASIEWCSAAPVFTRSLQAAADAGGDEVEGVAGDVGCWILKRRANSRYIHDETLLG